MQAALNASRFRMPANKVDYSDANMQ